MTSLVDMPLQKRWPRIVYPAISSRCAFHVVWRPRSLTILTLAFLLYQRYCFGLSFRLCLCLCLALAISTTRHLRLRPRHRSVDPPSLSLPATALIPSTPHSHSPRISTSDSLPSAPHPPYALPHPPPSHSSPPAPTSQPPIPPRNYPHTHSHS